MIVSIVLAAALGLAAMCFPTLMRYHWGRFFTTDSEILELTAVALPIAGLCELGNCPRTTGCGVLRGSARPTIGANINLGSFYLVGMPVAIFKGFLAKMGFSGLWIGLLAAQTSCALLMIYVLSTTDWIAEAEKARALINQWSSANLPLSITLSGAQVDHRSNEREEGYKKKSNLEEIVCINGEVVKTDFSLETDPFMSTSLSVLR